MMHERPFAVSLLVAGILALLLVAAGCSSDSGGGSSGASSASRSDTELTSLADEAASNSGISSFEEITESNAVEIGEAGAGATDSTGESSDPTFSLNAAPGASPADTAARALAQALNATGRAGGWLKRLGHGYNAETISETVDETIDCDSSGSVTASGTITGTVPDDPSSTSGTITIKIDNLDLEFDACSDGAATLWGELRYNVNNSLAYAVNSDETDITFNSTFDEYLDAGLVVLEVSTGDAYNFTLRETLAGTQVASFSQGVTSVNFTATLTVVDNATDLGFTCTATATTEAETENPEWSCSST